MSGGRAAQHSKRVNKKKNYFPPEKSISGILKTIGVL